jgi:hypothetical protein
MNASQDRYYIPPMKASDADRDQVLAALSENFQAGRLTSEELEDRTGRALSARTLDDLDELVADLPTAAPVGLGEPTDTGRQWAPGFARLPIVAVVAVVIIAGVLVGTTAGGHASRFLWLLIVVPVVARRLAVRRGGWPGPGRELPDRRDRGGRMLG